MSHTGRCFRDRRRTARRKAKQEAAVVEMRRWIPDAKMKGPFGPAVPVSFWALNSVSKQRIMEGYAKVLAGQPRRRGDGVSIARPLAAALAMLIVASLPAGAVTHWDHREVQPIAVTCIDVRRAVAMVGVEAARAQALQMGMTRSQERRAARCLKETSS